MMYIVYLTTNILNNMIYVGVHKTESLKFDGYLGNGINRFKSNIINPKTKFQFAVKKYGYDSFKRTIIKTFDNVEDALDLEAEIVDEEFLLRKDVYNMVLGGGLPPLLNKIIYRYDLQGNYLDSYNSIVEASKKFKISESSIGKAINFNRTSANFLWSDIKIDKLDLSKYNIYNPNIIIYCYNSNGTYENTFNSMSECTKCLDCNISNVQRAVKLGILVKGYYLSDKLYSIYEKPKTQRLTGMVHQYNLDGTYIQSFNSIKEAENKLNCNLQGINDAIKLNNSFYKNYLWARGEKLNSITPYNIPKSKARKIGQYTMDGELVKVFNTVRECRKQFPNVSKVLNGNANHCHNFKFKYIQ